MDMPGAVTICLEGRCSGHRSPPLLLLSSSLITYRDPDYRETLDANGRIIRSMILPASLSALGLLADFHRSKGLWTHIVCKRLPSGEALLLAIQPIVSDGARFTVGQIVG
jgi:hypothetical protein